MVAESASEKIRNLFMIKKKTFNNKEENGLHQPVFLGHLGKPTANVILNE